MIRVYFKNAFGYNTTKIGLPKSYYNVKRLVSKLGLQAKRIDWFVDGCMLFLITNMVKMMEHCLNANLVTSQGIVTKTPKQVTKN